MKSLPKISVVVAYCGLALAFGAVLFDAWSLRGWAGMVGFGLTGFALMTAPAPIPRPVAAMLGAYFVVSGAKFGLPMLGAARAPWAIVSVNVLWFGTVLGLLIVMWLQHVRRAPTAR
jgi:hypothetical protein